MISTSIILSTGEKKWMPMKFFGRFEFLARPVIGMVEVLEAKTAGRTDLCLDRFRRRLLDVRILEHRLDDQVASARSAYRSSA
jgi:hypothetical protein